MINFSILKKFNTTNERLKEVFTAMPDPNLGITPKSETKEERKERLQRKRRLERDIEVRRKFEKRFQARVEEGICLSLKNWRLYAAVDLAWDSTIINRATLPLMMYAQGKIDVQRATKALAAIPNGQRFLQRNEKSEVVGIDLPRFLETDFNLVRSVISRRHSAQKNKYNQLWPYYKYEPRSTGLVAKCRADVLSQRVDMMVDQFGYRNHDSQCMRDGLLYSRCVDFVRSSWEVEKQLEEAPDGEPRAVITKEGVGWIRPHPSRVFWDNAYPLTSINTDTGCEFLGFWDVVRFSEIADNPYYFNKDVVGYTHGMNKLWSTYEDYFSHYQYTVTPPYTGSIDISKENDAKSIVGLYSGLKTDASVFVTNFFEKIVPNAWGLGEYPYPVWIRFVIAANSTVLYAEVMPSTPAAYLGINENDSRQVNVSMAMDVMPFQDAMTNLLTQMLTICELEMFKIIGLNTDGLSAADAKYIKQSFLNGDWLKRPLVVEFSARKLEQMGLKAEQLRFFEVYESKQGGTITAIFEAMVRLVEMCEKLLALSPAEQGQPAPREISATEVNEIAATTSSVYSGISEDIDEYRAAKKRIVYESLVACARGEVVTPVKDRYTPETIRRAGFKPKENEDEDYVSPVPGNPRRITVVGSKKYLVHDYIFTTRDGSERPVNTQAANTLVQLVGQVLSVPMIAQAMGREKLYEVFNEIFRLSGAGLDLNLTLKQGESDSLGPDEIEALKQTVEQITQFLQQMGAQLQKSAQQIAEQEQVNAQQEQAIQGLRELAERVKTMAGHVGELQGKHEEIQKRLVETISYKDAPPSIQAQMEQQAGFTPAPNSERVKQEKKETPKK